MPNYANSTPMQLERRLQELDDEIRAACPNLVAERELVAQMLKALEAGRRKTYASTFNPRTAIELCLNLRGDFKLTKREMVDDILDGGYMGAKPKSARGTLNDSINQRIDRGVLLLKGELVGRPKRKPNDARDVDNAR
jgi:hypothetical protein